MFESLCARYWAVYAEALGHELYHYRDASGLESDFVIQMKNGQWAAFEAKLGATQVDDAVKNLLKMRDKLVAGGAKEPSCLAIICGLTKYGYTTPEGVNVIPITCLGI
jgi:hypothetical protein